MLSGSQTTSGDNVFNTVERKTVGTKLKVTPQVNEGDAVLLEIEQEVSSVDSSSNSTLGPTFNTRTIQNAVLVKTGETVVLGGLLDDFSKEQVSKVPLLGDIPLVGQLFRYTSTERAKRNLMVFIRPTIIRDDDVYRSLSKEKYTRYRQEQQLRIDGKSKALVGSEDLPVLNEHVQQSRPCAIVTVRHSYENSLTVPRQLGAGTTNWLSLFRGRDYLSRRYAIQTVTRYSTSSW